MKHTQTLLHKRTEHKKGQRHYRKYAIGEKVWLEGTNLKMTHLSSKLAPKHYGPFTITKVISPVVVRLKLPDRWQIHDVFHTSLIAPYTETPKHGLNFEQPAPELVDGEEEYEVEAILGSRRIGPKNKTKLQYLLKWKGYSATHNTWEPAENVDAPELLTAFYKAQPKAIRTLLLQQETTSPTFIPTTTTTITTPPLPNSLTICYMQHVPAQYDLSAPRPICPVHPSSFLYQSSFGLSTVYPSELYTASEKPLPDPCSPTLYPRITPLDDMLRESLFQACEFAVWAIQQPKPTCSIWEYLTPSTNRLWTSLANLPPPSWNEDLPDFGGLLRSDAAPFSPNNQLPSLPSSPASNVHDLPTSSVSPIQDDELGWALGNDGNIDDDEWPRSPIYDSMHPLYCKTCVERVVNSSSGTTANSAATRIMHTPYCGQCKRQNPGHLYVECPLHQWCEWCADYGHSGPSCHEPHQQYHGKRDVTVTSDLSSSFSSLTHRYIGRFSHLPLSSITFRSVLYVSLHLQVYP
jgi:Chromo (CHRromatin Organisation MOdifier) domain